MSKKSYDILFKLLLIGDSGVGKTCLIFRYVDDTFTPNFISTIGIDFKIKTIELKGKKIKLQIWDTAGQERFHTITSTYYRGAMGILLVYDISSRKSYDSVGRWLRSISDFASKDVEKILVGNKCDLSEHRAVSYEEGHQQALEKGFNFYEASAKGDTNVSRIFEELSASILNKLPARENENTDVAQGHRLNERPSHLPNACCGTS